MTLENWLEIGKIVAPQGLNGEMRVYPTSDFPERFMEPGQRWLLKPGQTEPQPVELMDGRYVPGKGVYVIQLAGVETREAVENLRNSRLFVPASDRGYLEADEYHILDLIGLEVFHQVTNENIGIVADIISAGHSLLVVKSQQPETEKNKTKDILIPFVKEIVPVVDIPSRRIEITPPPGLLEI